MYLLDTDTLTHLYADHPHVIRRLRELNESEVGTTIITRVEMLRGRLDFLLKAVGGAELLRAQEVLARTEAFLSQRIVVPLDDAAAAVFEQLHVKKGLKKLGRADLLIASICLAHRATLVTRNLRHFRQIPNLKLENWVD